MKTFVLSLGFVLVALVATGIVYESFDEYTTETYSMEHARVGHVAPPDGRLAWAAGEQEP